MCVGQAARVRGEGMSGRGRGWGNGPGQALDTSHHRL